jgi:phage major head subunit gpT-like protein
MAEKAKKHPASLVSDLLVKGHLATSVGYDGVPFFGNHTVGDNTYVNKSSSALNAENLAAAYDFMLSIKNDDDKAIGVTPNLLVVGATLRGTAHKLLKVQTLEGNTTLGLVDFIVDPNIVGNAWYLLDTTKSVRPIVLQVAKEPKLERDDKSMFDEAVVKFGTSWFGNAGYGMWQFAYMGGAN